MRIDTFIKKNRPELRAYITQAIGRMARIDTDEIRLWIDNDEYLYNWAKGEGVKFDE